MPASTSLRKRPSIDGNESNVAKKQKKSVASLNMSDAVTEQQIQSHLDTCIKMFIENKITLKNAWQLKVIDYVRMLTHKNKITSVACTSLDIASKVYSLRVDDLHNISLQLATSTTRLQNHNISIDNQSLVDEDVPKEQKKRKKSLRSMRPDKKGTVTNDVSKLSLIDIPKLQSSSYNYSESADNLNSANLFTAKFSMDGQTLQFKIMSSETTFVTASDTDESLSNALYLCKLQPFSGKICAAYEEFHIDRWNSDQEQVNASNFQTQADVAYDDQGLPMHELDGSVHDMFDGYNGQASETEEHVNCLRTKRARVEEIVDFYPVDGEHAENDCNYCSSNRVSGLTYMWAGPSYWKLKHIKPVARRIAGDLSNNIRIPERKRRPKVLPDDTIDFTVNSWRVDFTKKLNSKRSSTFHTFNIDKYNYPEQEVKDISMLYTIGSKSNVFLKRFRPQNKPLNNYDDNMNDLNCSPNVDDNFDEIASDEIINNHELNHPSISTNNLVEAPLTIEDVYVTYAKRAKQINIMKLKKHMWNVLTQNSATNEVPETTFKEFYRKLLQAVDSDMVSKLNPPLAIVGLLHLANERCLHLGQDKAHMSNFTIKTL